MIEVKGVTIIYIS